MVPGSGGETCETKRVEKLQSVYWVGVAAAGVNVALGLHALSAAGFDPGLVVAFIFGSIGLAAAAFGAWRSDGVIWGGGMLACALLTPTTFGFVPFFAVIFFLAFAGLTFWLTRRTK